MGPVADGLADPEPVDAELDCDCDFVVGVGDEVWDVAPPADVELELEPELETLMPRTLEAAVDDEPLPLPEFGTDEDPVDEPAVELGEDADVDVALTGAI